MDLILENVLLALKLIHSSFYFLFFALLVFCLELVLKMFLCSLLFTVTIVLAEFSAQWQNLNSQCSSMMQQPAPRSSVVDMNSYDVAHSTRVA